jgi:hypothetical protein
MLAMILRVLKVGSSSNATHALTTSRRLCGGMSVAMPTAMPDPPFNKRFGTRAGSIVGSSSEPSKFGAQSTVLAPSSCNNSVA